MNRYDLGRGGGGGGKGREIEGEKIKPILTHSCIVQCMSKNLVKLKK